MNNMSDKKPSLLQIQECLNTVSTGLISELRLPPSIDLTKSNLCHLLTKYTANLLRNNGLPVLRELHGDSYGNWHFILNHEGPNTAPSDDNLITNLNPWQWGGSGTGILHGTRGEVMDALSKYGAPNHFIALRGLDTIIKHNTDKLNPYLR